MEIMKKSVACGAVILTVLAASVLYFAGFTMQQMKVAFTFDDGTVDGYTVAAPILEKYGCRGVFAIINDKIGQPGFMTLDQIRDLATRGHTIASHMLSHCDVGSMCSNGDFAGARYQIEESKVSFARDGILIRYLTFPHGNHSEQAIELVKECGMQPLVIDRLDLGGGEGYTNPMLNVGDYLSRLARSHLYEQCVLMFHVVNDGVGYGGYGDNGEKFEQIVANIKQNEQEGGYIVVNYPDCSWTLDSTQSLQYRLRRKLRRLIIECLN